MRITLLTVLALALFATALGGCGDGKHAPRCNLEIASEGFTADELGIILTAVYEWHDLGLITFTPGIVQFCSHLDDAHCISVGRHEPDPRVMARAEMRRNAGLTWVGEQDDITVYIEHVRKQDEPSYWLHHAILHELGHHLGLDHDEDFTLMNPDGFGYACIGMQEIAHLTQLYGEQTPSLQPSCNSDDYSATIRILTKAGWGDAIE